MHNIETVAAEHKSVGEFSKAYFEYLNTILKGLDSAEIDACMSILETARQNNNTVFVVGNGGSASTASHMGIDLSGAGFKAGSERPLRVLSLTDNAAAITALANDFGYEHVFSKQLALHYQDGDVLVVISASGNSQNVVEAAKWMHQKGGKVIGLLGFDGGKLKELCDGAVVARTPKGDYGPVEDVHLILNHVYTLWMHLAYSKPR